MRVAVCARMSGNGKLIGKYLEVDIDAGDEGDYFLLILCIFEIKM